MPTVEATHRSIMEGKVADRITAEWPSPDGVKQHMHAELKNLREGFRAASDVVMAEA